jgi:hypothetical protein
MEHEYIDDGDSGVSRIESIDDLESKLLEQFRIMGTNDKDVLIGEFQKLLGRQSELHDLSILSRNEQLVCSYFVW